MLNNRIIGNSKTILPNIMKGIDRSEIGYVKEEFKELHREGLITLYGHRSREPYFSVNPSSVYEIKEILKYNSCPYCESYLTDLNYCNKCKRKI